jgi:hypothetical protein
MIFATVEPFRILAAGALAATGVSAVPRWQAAAGAIEGAGLYSIRAAFLYRES